MPNYENSGKSVFNPAYEVMPKGLEDILFDHELHDATLADLKAINPLVLVFNDEPSDEESVRFLDGGYSNIIFSAALKGIKEREPARVTLKIIQAYHLDLYFEIDQLISELEALAQAEIEKLTSK